MSVTLYKHLLYTLRILDLHELRSRVSSMKQPRIATKLQCNTGRKRRCTAVHTPYRNCLIFAFIATGCAKNGEKSRQKIAKNTRFHISPFALPPIGHCGEWFNIGAQLHLFRYKMSSKVCAKVQALW